MKRLGKILLTILALLVVAFLLMRVPDTGVEEMRAKYGAEPSQFVTLDDGLVVHLRDEGPQVIEGEVQTIILLHGSNADLHTWQKWADDLKQDHRVIRFDQIGHGLTGPSMNDQYALDAFVADVDRIADELGAEKFVLAGNSMGGAIAMAYAIEHPGRLDGLVLVDASGAPVKREGGGNLLFTLAAIPGVNSLMAQITPRSLVEKSLSQSVYNQDVVTDAAVDRYWELARMPGNRDATMKRFATPPRSFDPVDIAKVNVRTLVMWGEEDSLIPYEAAGWYMEHLPNATLAHYPKIGHIPMEEAAGQSVADLRGWLAENLQEDGTD